MHWYGALQYNLSAIDILSARRKLTRKSVKGKRYLTVFGPYATRQEVVRVIRKTGLPIGLGRSLKSNPMLPNHISTVGAVEIYDQIYAIEAKKGKDSLWPSEDFRHDFTKEGTKIYGLKDGSILIRGKQKLWKHFRYPKDVSQYG